MYKIQSWISYFWQGMVIAGSSVICSIVYPAYHCLTLLIKNISAWCLLLFLLQYQVDVNGPNTAPIYKFLKSSAGGFLGDLVKWNFEKFLVDKNGKVIERYPPTTSPFQIEVRHYISMLQVTPSLYIQSIFGLCVIHLFKMNIFFSIWL